MTISLRCTGRGRVALVGAVFATAVLAACGQVGRDQPQSSAAPPSPAVSASPAVEYDISRIDTVSGGFPPGFTTESQPAKTLDQHDIDTSGVGAFTGAQVDPPQCRALIVPPYAEPSVGTDAAGVRAQGDQGSIYAVALRRPQPIPPEPPPAGCDRVTMSGDPKANGTAEAIQAPDIAGATTAAVRLSLSAEDDPDYLFTAALDDHTTVVVMGSAAEDLNPPQLMSDLLVKSVAAVRGG